MICWKYDVPLGVSISNERDVALKASKLSAAGCECHRVQDKFKDATGHVVTTDLTIVQLEAVRKDVQAGRTLRNNTEQGGGGDIRELVEWSIGAYVNASSEIHDVPPSMFNELVKKVNQKADEMQTTTRAGG